MDIVASKLHLWHGINTVYNRLASSGQQNLYKEINVDSRGRGAKLVRRCGSPIDVFNFFKAEI